MATVDSPCSVDVPTLTYRWAAALRGLNGLPKEEEKEVVKLEEDLVVGHKRNCREVTLSYPLYTCRKFSTDLFFK